MLSYPIYTKEKSCSCGTYISSGNTHTHTSHKYVALRVLMCFEGNRNLDKREVLRVLGSTLTLEWSLWRDFWVEDLALKYNQMFLVEQMKNTKALNRSKFVLFEEQPKTKQNSNNSRNWGSKNRMSTRVGDEKCEWRGRQNRVRIWILLDWEGAGGRKTCFV